MRRRGGWKPLCMGLLLLQAACTLGPARSAWGGMSPRGGFRGAPSRYEQSCALSPVCAAPVAGGELVLPVAPTLVEVAETLEGLVMLKDFLDEAEVAQVEAVLVRCAKEADFQVNEREYGQGKSPSDIECDRVVGSNSEGKSITRAMELGTMKHDAAFACLERELGREFANHVTREPRYGQKTPGGSYRLTKEGLDSLKPDVVLHMDGNANTIQFLYDFLFPCTSNSKSDPLGHNGIKMQRKLEKYELLAGKSRPALVTPQLGVSR